MSRRLLKVAPLAAVLALSAIPGGASAAPQIASPIGKAGSLPTVADGPLPARAGANWLRGDKAAMGQRAAASVLSPPNAKNVELVSSLQLGTDEFGPVAPGQVADVAVHKNTAYLMSWAQPFDFAQNRCFRGGFWTVDISDPANPVQLNFNKALDQNYHGEGAHAITFPDGRDVLAVNNETCPSNPTPPPAAGGGFDLWDVSDPRNPQPLVRAAGDYAGLGSLVCCSANAPGAERQISNTYHSVFMWRDGARVYLVGVDNAERTRTDTDIFDITDPQNPVPVGEFDLDKEFRFKTGGYGNVPDDDGNPLDTNLHDMVVKEVGGVQTMIASYWDGGYVLLNVNNPAAPQYIGDSDFDAVDPLTGVEPPSGNAHQAEFSHDNKYILAADEEVISPYRASTKIGPGGPNEFEFQGWGDPSEGPVFSARSEFIGPTVFVGDGCVANTIPQATSPAKIAVIERGTCAFQVKVENADARGYDRVVVFNNSGANGCETLFDVLFSGYQGEAVSVFVTRQVGMRLIGAYDPATYTCTPGGATTPAPAPGPNGRDGLRLSMVAVFHGWGYAHQYKVGSGTLEEVGKPYAIPEGVDEKFALDYGDLSIHEWATDPDQNLAYSSYYAGGLRVVSFNSEGIKEQGHYIDGAGNNFWGVEQFTTSGGERLIAASDRDYGLYIFRYTGPDAPPDPVPVRAGATPTSTPAPPAAKDTTKPRISLLSRSRQSIRTLRGKGLSFRIRVDEQAKLSLSLRGRFTSTLKRRARGAARKLGTADVASVRAGQTVTVTIRPSAALRRKLRSERRLPALLSVEATDAAGNKATRTKTLTFR